MRLSSYTPLLLGVFLSTPAVAQEGCPVGSTCVPATDLRDMVRSLKELRCLKTEQPTFALDSITVITDKDGRVFVSGATPHPYSLRMKWCSFEAVGEGAVNVQAAMRQEPDHGFRFRAKAMVGVLGVEAFKRDPWTQAVDVGVAVEPYFYKIWNFSAFVGLRSIGGGVGFDLTRNFGLQVGYAATWVDWRHNPFVGSYFTFW